MNFKYFTIFVLVLTLLVSCGKNKKKEHDYNEYIRPASMYYSKQDTIDINNLVDEYLAHITNKEFEAAADMLYKFQSDSVAPLNEEARAKFLSLYKKLPVYAAKTKSFILNSDRNNQVCYLIQIAKGGDIEKEQGVMKLSLNPVVVDGKWYLTLLDSDAEGVEDVYKVR